MRSVVPLFLASTFALAACGGSSSGTTDPPATHDAGTTSTGDSGSSTADVAPAGMYPTGPYGSRVGSYFQSFSLQSCNNNNTWTFDQPDFYSSTMTVISIAAGWCVPCQLESQQMQATIANMYGSMGVRVVQILVQNPDMTMITPAFCNQWVARYGLQIPELMDPLMTTSVYTPGQAFPGNIIVDRRGIIRWREYGESTGLMDLQNAIQDVLANPNGS